MDLKIRLFFPNNGLFFISFYLAVIVNGLNLKSLLSPELSDSEALFKRLINVNPSTSLEILQAESISGMPKLHGTSVEFSEKSSLVLTPKLSSIDVCPWHLGACNSDELHIEFDLKTNTTNSRNHLFTISLDSHGESYRFIVNYDQENLLVQIKQKEISKVFQILFNGSQWVHFKCRVFLSSRNVEIRTDDHRASVVLPNDESLNMPNFLVREDNFTGVIFGTSSKGASFEIRNFNIHSDGYVPNLRFTQRYPDNMYREKIDTSGLMNVGTPINSLDYQKGGFVRYDFRNRVKILADDEEVSIKFALPTGNTEGILWYAVGSNNKSFSLIYVKDMKLFYTFQLSDSQHEAQYRVVEEIQLNKPLQPNVVHHLELKRRVEMDNPSDPNAGYKLSVTLNSIPLKEIPGVRAPFIPPDGLLYIGGTDGSNVLLDLIKDKVSGQFRGNISYILVSLGNQKENVNLDLINIITDPKWRGSVHPDKGVIVNIEVPNKPTIIRPTNGYTHENPRLRAYPEPMSFDGSGSAIIRDKTWEFVKEPSIEITFHTYEPEGVLFFVGPNYNHSDFICVEIFDGNVYFVYGIAQVYRHIQLNPEGYKVNDGRSHSVYFERTPEHRFKVKYNGQYVDVNQPNTGHQLSFGTYTYFGSVDQVNRLPWDVWSQVNFAGCIESVRVNNAGYLDFTMIHNQHSSAPLGVQMKCDAPPKVCKPSTCRGGTCMERYIPIYQIQKKFACECGYTDRTFEANVHDIRRSEACVRTAPIYEFDGDSVYVIDFENVGNTLKTHTDDFNLQFRTRQPNGPLFHIVSNTDLQYFKVDLIDGRVNVNTNMNRIREFINEETDDSSTGSHDKILSDESESDSDREANKYPSDRTYIVNTQNLADDEWHTLKIFRRADYIKILVDNDRGSSVQQGIIPRQKITFGQIAQQIYVGGESPANFQMYLPPRLGEWQIPIHMHKFRGEMRNFYWNRHDFFGSDQPSSYYIGTFHRPRFTIPDFPGWPRVPSYTVTTTPRLLFASFSRQLVDFNDVGHTLMMEFKTKYDGVLLHIRGVSNYTSPHFTILLLRGHLYIIYDLPGSSVQGIYRSQVTGNQGRLTDNQWHRFAFSFDRSDKRLVLYVDNSAPEYFGKNLKLNDLPKFNMYVGGLSDADWRGVLQIISSQIPNLVTQDIFQRPPAITGCLGSLSFSIDKFQSDWFRVYEDRLRVWPKNELIRNQCRDLMRCTTDYCANGGKCIQITDTEISCRCDETDFEGQRCENILTCPANFCDNGGLCVMYGREPRCDCSSSGFTGDRCEISPCNTDGICRNGGQCFMQDRRARCDCSAIDYYGDRCENSICPSGFCGAGTCYVDSNRRPVCDCSGTGFTGNNCQDIVCVSGYCQNGGVCLVDSNRPVCDCQNTNFGGMRCDVPICTQNYCLNNGRCHTGPNKIPVCDCSGTYFSGERCEQAICPPNFCYNGGFCSVDEQTQRPVCNCKGTGFRGSQCEHSVCDTIGCQNGGRCQLDERESPRCNCQGTGYKGPLCNQPVCSVNECSGNGRCDGTSGQPICTCLPGFTGDRCHIEICPKNYCQGGGICRPDRTDPVCECPDSREGPRCEFRKHCEPDELCSNGGRCYMINGQARCDCSRTSYIGLKCEIPTLCPVGYCNVGTCQVVDRQYVCDCSKTAFRGVRCDVPKECPVNHCANNGICKVIGEGEYVCDCQRTGRTGPKCNEEVTGMLIPYDNPGYIRVDLLPPPTYREDNVTIGFKTYLRSGTLVTFFANDGRNWSLKLKDRWLVLTINGNDVYLFSNHPFANGEYQVLSIRRVGNNMEITILGSQESGSLKNVETLTNPQGDVTYTHYFIGADNNEKDIFKGAIGGFHWNGRYPMESFRRGEISPVGNVTSIYLPSYQLDKPPTQPQCTTGYCRNNGICYSENYQLKCDCSRTGYYGSNCQNQYYGFLPIYDGNRGENYVKLIFSPELVTQSDEMRVIFQTQDNNGWLLHTQSSDPSRYRAHGLYMNNGKMYAVVNNQQHLLSSEANRPLNDGQAHVINMIRTSDHFNYTIDRYATSTFTAPGLTTDGGKLYTKEIYLGANPKGEDHFYGAIGGFIWNGKDLIDKNTGAFTKDVQVMNRGTPVKQDTVNITLIPVFTPKPKIPENKPVPDDVPLGPWEHGGAIFDSDSIYLSGAGEGAGVASLPSDNPVTLNNAALFGGLGAINPMLAGLLVLLLLILSALIWACWRCKPGCCPPFIGSGGDGLKKVFCSAPEKDILNPQVSNGINLQVDEPIITDKSPLVSAVPSINENNLDGMNALVSVLREIPTPQSSSSKKVEENVDVSNVQKQPVLTATNVHMKEVNDGMAYGYGHDRMLDLSPGEDSFKLAPIAPTKMLVRYDPNMGLEPPLLVESDVQNVYNTGMKVDTCIISNNSKYVVTGSATGPPQIWDMQSGNLCKVMDGLECAATNLHLGVDDTVLVGQVLDDYQGYGCGNMKLYRLQLWNFATGNQLEMPEEIFCTTSCMTRRDQQNVILARYGAHTGSSILAWDLIGNQINREIFYQPVKTILREEPVTFLDISHNDRLVVAGIYSPTEDVSYYMVFDLSMSFVNYAIPRVITFNAEVQATAILSDDEAITGTKRGELIIWNLHTAQPVRQIQISATLEGQNQMLLPPHNDTVHCIAVSKDGNFIVTGSKDYTVRVWHKADERLMHTLNGHADEVSSVFISIDSEDIISGSIDGSIRMWRLRDGNQLCWFASNIEILEVKISNDKRCIVALGERSGYRKLIMLQILRNRTRLTTTLRSTGSRSQLGSAAPYSIGFGTEPSSPMMVS